MKLYGIHEAAEYLGMTVDGLKYHLKRGNIAGQRIGHSLVFTERDLKAFGRRRRGRGRPPAPKRGRKE